jgi:microsomal dipeptidase-like Zn-dependent dipeptidase
MMFETASPGAPRHRLGSALRTVTVLAGITLAACGSSSPPADGAGQGPVANRFAMANSCFAVRSNDTGQFIAKTDGTYLASGDEVSQAAPFFFRPTTLGSYLLYDADAQFLGISDPLGELLDELGNFVGMVGELLAGVGDTVGVVAPLRPIGGIIRDISTGLLGGIGGGLGDVEIRPSLGARNTPSDLATWIVEMPARDRFTLSDKVSGQRLVVSEDSGALVLANADVLDEAGTFSLLPSEGCAEFPEITTNATGTPFKGTNPDGTVFGYADTHIHIGAYEFIGGRVNYGSPFHKFGVTHALDNCAVNHGPGGTIGILEHFTSGSPLPLRLHETQGWPTFTDWPHHSSLQHHQTYYKWIERMWLGGLRFMVNHMTGNETLCQIYPLVRNDCNSMENARLQIQRMHELQDYIDAQSGGPGKGFFRIVHEPDQARRVIKDGKLAVMLGLEFSHLFDCKEDFGQARCTPEDIDRQLDEFHDLGIRAIFPIHRFDNAFGGAFNGTGVTETVISAGNILSGGQPFQLEACGPEEEDANAQPGPTLFESILLTVSFYFNALPGLSDLNAILNPVGEERLCNARGITDLGEYLIDRLIDKRILIEIDHMGDRVRDRTLDILEERAYPGVVSSHGFLTSRRAEHRVVATGGMVNNFAAPARSWANRINNIAVYENRDFYFATGFASDINGIANQPGPRGDATETPLIYPFTSVDGGVVFDRQVSGERVYDLNLDGVAHYGLYPDLIADMQQNAGPEGRQAVDILFRSAEAYLQMWERTVRYQP